MSLINSHHDLLIKERSNTFYISDNLLDLTTQVTFEIVQKHPGLIADVEIGNISDSVLKAEIIQTVDELNLICDRDELIQSVMNYMFGYGTIQHLIDDDDISDIDVPRYNVIMIKRNGKKEILSLSFNSEGEFERFCKLVIIRNGGIINENDAHARVSDAHYRLRINVTIAPRSVTGPSLCIRKHRRSPYDLDGLLKLGMMSVEANRILLKIMGEHNRIIISGKGASGKTTLLRALLEQTNKTERILVCEKDLELHLEGTNFVVQRIKKNGHRVEQSLRDLIADGLTMSLDGYCIGEVIGDEAWEFVKAGHTDHRIFGTIHANSPNDVIQRLLMLIEPVTSISEERLEYLIYQSLDYIIHMNAFKIVSIQRLKGEGDKRWLETLI